MMAHISEAGIRALFSSAKNAIPEGNERTPAPTILFAKLKVDVAIVEVWASSTAALAAAACSVI
jgi:hypothetical protein